MVKITKFYRNYFANCGSSAHSISGRPSCSEGSTILLRASMFRAKAPVSRKMEPVKSEVLVAGSQ